MALIKCSECGKEFSNKANACPNCACPIEAIEELNEIEEPQEFDEEIIVTENNNNDNEIINEQFSFFNGISKANAKKVKKGAKISFLIGTVISFFIFSAIFKTNIGLNIFISLITGIGITMVVMSVMNLYYYFAKRKFTESEKKQNKTSIIIFIVIFIIFTLIFAFILGFDNNGENVPTDSQLNACRQQSTTYTKCSWSTFENKCVCKFR